MKEIATDILVIGGGLAGCHAALRARELGHRVVIVEKQHIMHSGEACMGLKDFFALIPGIGDKAKEMENQRRATQGLMEEYFTELILDGSFEGIERLERWGIRVRNDKGELVYDSSMFWTCNVYIWEGASLKRNLAKTCIKHGIKVINRVMVTDFLVEEGRVIGAVGFNTREGELYIFRAKATILSTGGCTRLYQSASGENYNRWRNPYLTGDGYAASLRAGAALKHMEFVQGTLVPKDFSAPGINAFIGVGAKLLNSRGERFMGRYSGEQMERAPRQLLAHAVFTEIKEGRGPIFLDFRGLPQEKYGILERGFRNEKPIYANYLAQRGVDLRGDLLEIEVSEPYIRGMATGGLVIDKDFQSTLPGLFAMGDVTAYSSFYSAMGAMVLGWVGGERACSYAEGLKEVPQASDKTLDPLLERLQAPLLRKEGTPPEFIERNLQRIMSSYAQYERNEVGLTIGLERVRALNSFARDGIKASDPYELVKAHEALNMLEIAEPVIMAARARKESRMFLNHRRTDYPQRDDEHFKVHIILRRRGEELELSFQKV